MSLTKWVMVRCDICEDEDVAGGGTTAREAREEAVSLGWHRSTGTDYCPGCWQRLLRENEDSP